MESADTASWCRALRSTLGDYAAARLPGLARLLAVGADSLGHAPEVLDAVLDRAATCESVALHLWSELDTAETETVPLGRVLNDAVADAACRVTAALCLCYLPAPQDRETRVAVGLGAVLREVLVAIARRLAPGGGLELTVRHEGSPQLVLALQGVMPGTDPFHELLVALLASFGCTWSDGPTARLCLHLPAPSSPAS